MDCKLLQHMEKILGIDGLFLNIKEKKTSIPLVLVGLNTDSWDCLSEVEYNGRGVVHFTHGKESCEINVDVKNTICGTLNLTFLTKLPGEIEQKQLSWIKLNTGAEQRRGTRYSVGLRDNKWKVFGLQSQRQQLLFGKKRIDVVLSNVSYHGALVTGENVNDLSLVVGKQIVHLCVNFTHPSEAIVLDAIIVRVEKPIPKISQYALSFVNPSTCWMNRVEMYATSMIQ